jgi:hypothetical protein
MHAGHMRREQRDDLRAAEVSGDDAQRGHGSSEDRGVTIASESPNFSKIAIQRISRSRVIAYSCLRGRWKIRPLGVTARPPVEVSMASTPSRII